MEDEAMICQTVVLMISLSQETDCIVAKNELLTSMS